MLKIAVFAPMPRPSVSTAIAVKPRFLRSIRMPNASRVAALLFGLLDSAQI